MKRLVGGAKTKRIMPFALAAIAVLCIPGRAWAPTAVEYAVVGTWHGFFLSSLTGESGPFTINNTEQRNRRFGGTLDVGNLMIPYEGTSRPAVASRWWAGGPTGSSRSTTASSCRTETEPPLP